MTDELRADSMTGEQWVFEERTADPATTMEGERWLRTDLTPETNQIATLRVDVGGSVVDVPVFATGTSETGVDEALRLRVGGQTGYIPITTPADAAFNNLRMQHNGSTLAYHNRVEPGSAIPDSVETQYRFEDDSDTTTAIDAVGSNDANLNGGSFDSDAADGSFAWLSDGLSDYGVSQNTVDLSALGDTVGAGVGGYLKPSTTGAFQYPIGWDAGSGNYLYVTITDSDEWRAVFRSDSNNDFITAVGPAISTSSYQHVVATVDDSTLYLLVDGSQAATASIGSNDPTTIGSGSLVFARQENGADAYYGGLQDNPSYANDRLTESDQQALM